MKLTRKDIFLALAKLVPGEDGKLIDNPNKTWKDVNSALPATKIEVLGPPPTSDKAAGEEGYLTEKGLIPMPEAEGAKFRQDAKSLTPMSAL